MTGAALAGQGAKEMSKKILHIEDDQFSRLLVRRTLEKEGYAVLEAEDGLTGIQVAQDQAPDLILMDIHIPGLDGYEAATKLKSMPALADAPIVALTASREPGDRERSLISGCDGYITKPIQPDTLAAQVRAFLEGKRETLDEGQANYYLREYRDKLVNRLQVQVEELSRLNAELEQRVEERTRALQEAQARLMAAEKEKAVVELAYAVAHELRQPQTVIVGLVELIAADKYDPTQLRQALQTIAEQIKKMSHLIDTMGQLTSVKTKTFGDSIRIVDLEESARQNGGPQGGESAF
jgi:CheY-like chemotaxis protein